MKTYLITGANGLLGQTLVKMAAAQQGIRVVATGRGPCRLTQNEGFEYHAVDLTQKAALQDLIRSVGPDVLINTAAMTQVDQCHDQPERCDVVNHQAVRWMVQACEPLNTHLVHVSTDFVFDGENGPYQEEDPVQPISIYGESKLAAEHAVEAATCPWAIVRTVLVFGLVDDMSRSNLILWVKKSLEEGKIIRVVSDQIRTPTLVDDLALGCLRIAQRQKSGMFHVSGGDTLSIIEMAIKTADYFGLDRNLIQPVTSAELAQVAKRPPVTGFVLDKARGELDYQPHTFDETLAIIAQRFGA